jgi:DNA-binding NtrC family response regulator
MSMSQHMARILIVEDEPLISIMLEDWVTELGHAPVGPVESVEGALAAINEGAVDAVILDFHLQGVRADAVATVLIEKNVPFAFASGDSSGPADADFAGQVMLNKPYDYEAVRLAVSALVASVNK